MAGSFCGVFCARDKIQHNMFELVHLEEKYQIRGRKKEWSKRTRNRILMEWSIYIHIHGKAFIQHVISSCKGDVDEEATMTLITELCAATHLGEMPSFSNEGARVGYFLKKSNRIGNLTRLVFQPENDTLRHFLQALPILKIASIGGGPGYDALGWALCAEWMGRNHKEETHIEAHVYDYEKGWKDIIDTMQGICTTHKVPITWSFDTCDITSVDSSYNDSLWDVVDKMHLFLFSFVVVENRHRLKQTEFSFLKQIFSKSSNGSWYIFTDSTYRLWPSIYEIAKSSLNNTFRLRMVYTYTSHIVLMLEQIDSTVDLSTDTIHQKSLNMLEKLHIDGESEEL